ncbi:Schwannomin-interacting protein 1 [Amphibalanus amphitrite]|uniref:Schwannomin-interacting protein 1 n=1 Tax=Amphibalanus amphitrite TaxID=1232801 RepID=A0A6A4V2T3_AMPAM|nr:Schwannomin-interacting protein 1 [Amphibalanus amphitrite]
MSLDGLVSSLKEQSAKVSMDSIKQGTQNISSSLASTLKSQTSKVSAVSADIAQRFRNDLNAWSNSPAIYAWRQEQSKRGGIWPFTTQSDGARKAVTAEPANPKAEQLVDGPTEEELENIVDKFIKVITPNEEEESQQVVRKNFNFKHMRDYSFYRRNDREAIRRKLAMGHEPEEGAAAAMGAAAGVRPGRKPSLQSRLQGGMNLQICFMNETASDDEDEDEELGGGLLARRISGAAQPEPAAFQSLPVDLNDWPKFSQPPPVARESGEPARTADFVRHQAQLQAEARLALAQAKQMARMQMEIERQSRKSPISDVVRVAFQKIGVPFPDGRRRVSRQLLTEMNIAQLQVIVNDFHARIEGLNEALVRYLMERDEQHMEQDSKLVHIEDLTSYFGQKHQDAPPPQPPPPQPAGADSKRKPLRIGLGRAK